MRGLEFVNLVSERVARQKKIDESMHVSHTSLSPPSLTSHLFRAIIFTIQIYIYITFTERINDGKKMQAWLKSKKSKKRRPKFDLRIYTRNTVTNMHEIKVGGFRNPYCLEVSRNEVAVTLPLADLMNPYVGILMSQGIQYVPAERLGTWREDKSSGKKKWSSSFHTAEFPAPPDRAQKYKLKNQATVRVRTLSPKLP